MVGGLWCARIQSGPVRSMGHEAGLPGNRSRRISDVQFVFPTRSRTVDRTRAGRFIARAR